MADRYTNYDNLLKKWHDLGLDEISKIHKVNAFNHFIKTLPVADVVEVRKLTPCDLCAYNPPSSFYGKPCTLCPAEKKERSD